MFCCFSSHTLDGKYPRHGLHPGAVVELTAHLVRFPVRGDNPVREPLGWGGDEVPESN